MATETAGLSGVLTIGMQVQACRPWPRFVVEEWTWRSLVEGLATGRWDLLGLWGEPDAVHMVLREPESGFVAIASVACAGGRFPSVGREHFPALRLERTIIDLTGLSPAGAYDARPWLDHGRWPAGQPHGRGRPSVPSEPYRFLPVEGEGLHEIPVGPVHAGIIEPGHFRFTVNGETVVRLEERLGYVHKGIEHLMQGQTLDHAARLAGRVSGDSTVAYALAFARAAESATGAEAMPRAHWLRALMAELERVANHLGDIGAICNDAGFALLQAHCGILRETVLQACEACFGHRLMMDCIVPFGLARDLDEESLSAIRTLTGPVRNRFQRLVATYDNTASLQDRTVGTGVLAADLAQRYACGGFVGRASGRDFDTRRAAPFVPYDTLDVAVPVLHEGDVNARVWIRIREVQASLDLIDRILEQLPGGDFMTLPPPRPTGEGVALVEGFRGDILVWVRVAAGRVERCHLRDPSWFQWPLLEAAIEGNIVADFPLCNKSFNCSYSGHDL
jgi:Ni,Fe-hydrogenase III large subunit